MKCQLVPQRGNSRILPSRVRTVVCRASSDRTETLRKLLASPGILKGPCCHDALSAKLIEQAGFPYAFMSGFCTAAARLGAPDTGLISYAEMVDQGRLIHEATSKIPIIGDGDTGYGNAMNVKRTVKGYAAAGFAGILLEDQVAPKSCGHVRGKRVCSREEAVSRIKAAVEARDRSGKDIVIVARTDARQAAGLEEALWRVEAFADAGADVLFIDALESTEEMERFLAAGGAARRAPKMANNLEGGGKTPVLAPEVLEKMGFKLVAYPLSLLGVSVRAMQLALAGLKEGRVPPPSQLPSFAELQQTIGFDEYFRESDRFAVPLQATIPVIPGYEVILRPIGGGGGGQGGQEAAAPAAPGGGTQGQAAVEAARRAEDQEAARKAGESATRAAAAAAAGAAAAALAAEGRAAAAEPPATAVVEDAGPTRPPPRNKFWREELSPSRPGSAGPSQAAVEAQAEEPGQAAAPGPGGAALVAVPAEEGEGEREGKEGPVVEVLSIGDEDPFGRGSRRPRGGGTVLRIRVSSQATGEVKLETRIPAGFLDGVAAFIPEVKGIDLEALVAGATGTDKRNPSDPIIDFPVESDRVQIWIESGQ